jgi:hypothetical protein
MVTSRIYEICNAYESGHGYQNDEKDGDYYSNPELNEAYKIGYRAGYDDFLSNEAIYYPPVTIS